MSFSVYLWLASGCVLVLRGLGLWLESVTAAINVGFKSIATITRRGSSLAFVFQGESLRLSDER